MPLTRLSVPAHLPDSLAQALAGAVQDALVQTCAVPQDDSFQLVQRFPPGSMLLDPHFGGVSRSDDACVIEIMFLQGRSDAQKRALYRGVAERAHQIGLRPDDLLVALAENGPIDWSLGRGQAYGD
ncbi:MAG TPA: tautomerase family protein [Ramlibacter sp.]|nr:tautomerase family protein [Ramlibacter sp.]